LLEAVVATDLDAAMSFFASDAAWDTPPGGLGSYEGRVAIRGFSRSTTSATRRIVSSRSLI
jgi:hypothetical protein